MMKKFVFLDFDGVITTVRSSWRFDLEKVMMIQRLCDETGARVVVTSSWRRRTVQEMIDTCIEAWAGGVGGIAHSINDVPQWITDIAGVTDRAYSHIKKDGGVYYMPRGLEIRWWIDNNVKNADGKYNEYNEYGKDYRYVILDDDTDMLLEQQSVFVQTDSLNGVSEDDIDKCISILNQ